MLSRRTRITKRYHLPVVIEQDENGVFIVSVPTMRGCGSYGRSIGEAIKNIAEAANMCLHDERPMQTLTFVAMRDLEIVAKNRRS